MSWASPYEVKRELAMAVAETGGKDAARTRRQGCLRYTDAGGM
jgi:hypothetical protein